MSTRRRSQQASGTPSTSNPHRGARQPMLVVSRRISSNLLPAIRDAAHEREWRMLDLTLTSGLVPEGIVPDLAIISTRANDNPLRKNLQATGCRIVRVGPKPDTTDDTCPAVTDDPAQEGRLAAAHFAERNFHAVGFPLWTGHSERFKAFRDHARELGCKCYPLVFKMGRQGKGESGEKWRKKSFTRSLKIFKEWAETVPMPIGLACPTDLLAARYTYMALQHGLRVPHDIAILGRGDLPGICECSAVGLSSIRLNRDEHIAPVFQIFDRMLAGQATSTEPVMIPADGITVRASTDVRAASDQGVSEALQFIWSHYDDVDLSVDRVAEAVGSSRRKLEYSFRSELDDTINAVILGRRLERCRYLLITTDITVSDLCHHTGFRSKKHLHRVFKQAHGITPLKYRTSQRNTRAQ